VDPKAKAKGETGERRKETGDRRHGHRHWAGYKTEMKIAAGDNRQETRSPE